MLDKGHRVALGDALGVRPGLGLAGRFLVRGVVQAQLCGVVLVVLEGEARSAVDGFWLAMVGRARAALGFGAPMTLAALTEAVTVERSPLAGLSIDGRSGYFTEGEAALLVPRSSLISVPLPDPVRISPKWAGTAPAAGDTSEKTRAP